VVSAIAFCPSPPLLVPELAAGAAVELDPLRAACQEAVRRLLAACPDEVVVIGTGPGDARFPPGSTGTLAGYGVPVTATLPGAPPRPASLPLPLTLGAWLLAGVDVPCSAVSVGPGAHPLDLPDRPAVLVMGDGSARRSERAPGYVDDRAAGFDAAVAEALATGDAAALRNLDPVLGAELLAAGVPAWRAVGRMLTAGERAQVPTAAARAAGGTADRSGGGTYDAELLHADAPYGVGYLVATWVAR
jgi:hypothetical protein